MELEQGNVAVVTGAASGIGLALSNRFAAQGMHVVMADVEADRLAAAAESVRTAGGEVLDLVCDVRLPESVDALAAATMERFGRVDVVCNNAGVTSRANPWFGPIEAWHWVLGVNMFGVVHGARAFLPHFLAAGRGYFVNTASMLGLMPGMSETYDASKHAVVALTEDLYHTLQALGGTVGVSCLCPGWVRTDILTGDRNYPSEFGTAEQDPLGEIPQRYVSHAIAEGTTPAAVAEWVVEAIAENRYWILPEADYLPPIFDRWDSIRAGANPQLPEHVPGLPPMSEIRAETLRALGLEG